MNNINKITLEYLLNQNKYDKINYRNNSNFNINNFQKYKSEILEITDNMFNNNFINDEIRDIFITYCKNLIYHINNNKFKTEMQKEYIDLKPREKKINIIVDNSINNLKLDNTLSNNSLTNNSLCNKSIKLDNFVIKNKPKKNNKILPKKKNNN